MTIASGTFIWIVIFWMLMPSTKGTMQFRVKTSLLVHLMTPLVPQKTGAFSSYGFLRLRKSCCGGAVLHSRYEKAKKMCICSPADYLLNSSCLALYSYSDLQKLGCRSILGGILC
jgi:hypothetical protein